LKRKKKRGIFLKPKIFYLITSQMEFPMTKLFSIFIVSAVIIFGFSNRADAVYSCGGVEDTCTCGANNPYPCCDNGGNCTWYSWHSACCNWGMALPGWGNANTWAQYATANPNFEVLPDPVIGSIACRTLGTYGHVAFVVGISGSEISVEEQNCCTTCAGGMRTWTYESSYFDAGFIIPMGGVTPPACSIEIDGTDVIIDDQDDCFERHGEWWWDESTGNENHAFYTYATDESLPDSWGSWRFNVTVAGNYEISVMIPDSENELAQETTYTVSHINGETQVSINQATNESQWVTVGQFWLEEGTNQYIKLSDNTGESYDLRRVVMFDAVALSPVTQCEDECTILDEIVCEGANGFRTCGDYDGDDCLEWSSTDFCGTGQVCSDGLCQTGTEQCEDECTIEGSFSCATTTSIRSCGQFNTDSCLEFSETTECQVGEVCSNGICTDSTDGGVDEDGGVKNDPTNSGCSCKNGGTTHSNQSLPFIILLFLTTVIFRKTKSIISNR
jgi:CHAP domain